ncbi:MAG: tetratricopeptide repeat protein [Anaerolineales bacterium]|nr:tetratricopeptide repeat protein [Anaerolineales bacterium]
MTNQQVLEALVDADVVIDQIHVPGGGKLTLEGMACGCAGDSAVREQLEPYFSLRPIWKIDPENIEQQLEQLLTDKELRLELAAEGRAYVEQYHDRVTVAERILNALAQTEATDLTYDYYPTFFTRHYRLPEDQVIPTYLKRLTAAVIQRYGLPADADVGDLLERGLISAEGLDMDQPIAVWPYASRCYSDVSRNIVHFDQALQTYYQAVTICPQALIATSERAILDLIQKGNDYIYCGHNQAAMSSYQKAVAFNPNSPAAHFGLRNLYLSNALFEQAADHYLQTDNLYPGFGMIYFYLALAITFQNRADEALPILERAILNIPRQPREQVWVGDPHPSLPSLQSGEGMGVRPIPRPLLYGHLTKDRRRIRGVLYFKDLPPAWIHPNLQIAIAPYFAFLYTLLNAANLHLPPGSGPLATTPFSPVETGLYKLAGVETASVPQQ